MTAMLALALGGEVTAVDSAVGLRLGDAGASVACASGLKSDAAAECALACRKALGSLEKVISESIIPAIYHRGLS